MPAEQPSRTVRLSPAIYKVVATFCARSVRHPPQLVRQIVALFFADGFEVAERRLRAQNWDVDVPERLKAPIQVPDMAGWTAQERAEWYVTGNEPDRLKRERDAG